MKGIVFKSTGSWYTVRLENGEVVEARIKGKFRLKEIKSTNPIAVGDYVTLGNEEGSYVIEEIAPRQNYIIRKSNNLSKQTHILASNITQALLVVTTTSPLTSSGFIDRFLVAAGSFHIPVILAFNKYDILSEEEKQVQQERIDLYANIGYTCIEICAVNGYHLAELKELLLNKTTLIAGHSGTGKSTLLNALNPEVSKQRTGKISGFSNKGIHTTTFAEMFELFFDSFIIDTPGIKDFGVVHLEPKEIKEYMVEFLPFAPQCRFNDCNHINEPQCAVQQAVNDGKISGERYYSYLSMFHNPV